MKSNLKATIQKNGIFIFLLVLIGNMNARTFGKQSNMSNSNQSLTAFFLRDPSDGMCLGTTGFTECNTESLWLYASRDDSQGHSLVLVLYPDSNLSCLTGHTSGLRGGQCSRREAMQWLIEGPNSSNNYRLKYLDKRELCVARYKSGGKKDVTGYKGRLRNSASLIPCNQSSNIEEETGYVQLEVVETAVSTFTNSVPTYHSLTSFCRFMMSVFI